MSVLKRNRSESQLEFYNTATQIRTEITRFVMNEKIVPKRYRPIFTFPTTALLIKMMNNITAANTIYPQSLKEAEKRREYQTEAIITVEQIFQQLHYMITTLSVDANKFRPVTKMLSKEVQLLRGWRKADYKFIKEFQEKAPVEIPQEPEE